MTEEHVPPNFLNPEAIQSVLDMSTGPDRRAQMLFAPNSWHGAKEIYSVFVESTPEGDWWRTPTDKEREAEWRAEHDANEAAERAAIAVHKKLVKSAKGLRKAILKLHAPEVGGCAGCESCCCSPNWPCFTYTLARDWEE